MDKYKKKYNLEKQKYTILRDQLYQELETYCRKNDIKGDVRTMVDKNKSDADNLRVMYAKVMNSSHSTIEDIMNQPMHGGYFNSSDTENKISFLEKIAEILRKLKERIVRNANLSTDGSKDQTESTDGSTDQTSLPTEPPTEPPTGPPPTEPPTEPPTGPPPTEQPTGPPPTEPPPTEQTTDLNESTAKIQSMNGGDFEMIGIDNFVIGGGEGESEEDREFRTKFQSIEFIKTNYLNWYDELTKKTINQTLVHNLNKKLMNSFEEIVKAFNHEKKIAKNQKGGGEKSSSHILDTAMKLSHDDNEYKIPCSTLRRLKLDNSWSKMIDGIMYVSYVDSNNFLHFYKLDKEQNSQHIEYNVSEEENILDENDENDKKDIFKLICRVEAKCIYEYNNYFESKEYIGNLIQTFPVKIQNGLDEFLESLVNELDYRFLQNHHKSIGCSRQLYADYSLRAKLEKNEGIYQIIITNDLKGLYDDDDDDDEDEDEDEY